MFLGVKAASASSLFAFLILAITLAFGLWPGTPAPVNELRSSVDGLQLLAPSQAISRGDLLAHGGEGSLELWFEQHEPSASGNLSILGLWRDGRAQLILGQWPGGFYLHNHADNPGGWPELDRYALVPEKQGLRHAALRITENEIHLAIDGEALDVMIPLRPKESDPGFGGRLLVGATSFEEDAFSGLVRAAAFHSRRLEGDELRSRAKTEPSMLFERGMTEDLQAFYLFAAEGIEDAGRMPASAPEFYAPLRVGSPDPGFLRVGISSRWPWSSILWDLSINLFGFMPLGWVLAVHARRHPLLVAFLAGLALSLAIEVTQYWLPGRQSSAVDLLCNGIGAWIGAISTRAFPS